MVRRVVPDNVHLANEDGTANGHGDRDDRKIHAREFETVLSVQARTQFRALSTSAILSSETALFTVSSELSMQPDK